MLLALAPVCGLACGDANDGSSSFSGSGGVSVTEPASTGTTVETPTTSTGTGTPTDGMSATGDVSTGSTAGVDSTGDSTGGGPKFDLMSAPDIPGGECLGTCGRISDFSYIWIANSTESTVSKINTRTLVEEGRYRTRETPGNPSRTSVSVDGRAVAVANRNGGVIKIWARPDDCKGPNTSTGPADVKPWGMDDCVAWYTDFPEADSQRPVAWTTGEYDPITCKWVNQKIWTGEGRDPSTQTEGGFCKDDFIYVHRLDGETGVIEDTLQLPFPCTTFGLYGGAVDSKNDLWLTRLFENSPGAIRVDFETLEYDTVGPFFGYGITVDHNGRIWGGTGVPGRWDPELQMWQTIVGNIQNSGVGLAEDNEGRMWVGITGGIQAIDVETLALGQTVMFAGENVQSKGISVDFDGFIWAVPDNADRAYRVDPVDFTYEKIGGLVGAYTYSDMTGGSLKSVACNPPG
jgi:hypothetical protein